MESLATVLRDGWDVRENLPEERQQMAVFFDYLSRQLDMYEENEDFLSDELFNIKD